MTGEELSKSIPENVQNNLQKYYNTYKKCLKVLVIPICLLVVSVVLFTTQILTGNISVFFMVFGIIFLVVCIILCCSNHKNLNKLYKNEILSRVFSSTFDNYNYQPNSHVRDDLIWKSRLISRQEVDIVRGGDFISGSYKGVPFYQSFLDLIRVEYTTDSEGHVERHEFSVFKGRWMCFEFNKNFLTDIMVCERFKRGDTSGMTKVCLESEVFNKKFKTYAQSEHDCFYILTPQIMEKLLELEAQNPGAFMMSFQAGNLTIALANSKTSFSVSTKGKYDIVKLCDNAMLEIKIITDIVDMLELNKKVFK